MNDESKTGSSPQVSSEPKANYPHPLLMMWRVLLSLPLAVVWMAAYGLIIAGWGLRTADGMLAAWNEWAENWE